MHGSSFSAIDVIVGYSVRQFFSKDLVDASAERDYVKLNEYNSRITSRAAFVRAISE